jgi:hypothetical protein
VTWADRSLPVKAGDRVCYSAAFLRSIGCYAGDMPQARGLVTGLKAVGEVTLAEIEWDPEGMPERVNVKNLSRVTERGIVE